jgi:ubiquitin carboxyl-terminal hydrolase L3
MNRLGYQLGIPREFSFYDVYSLHDPDLLAFVPRPVYALLVIVPITDAWAKSRVAEDAAQEWYSKSGPDEPVLWFQQTITHGCGSIGLLHCALNGPVAEMIKPGSYLEQLLNEALPLKMAERAKLLVDSDTLYTEHQAVAELGDTKADPSGVSGEGHFVAFVKAKDGRLWELEGSRKGPIDRGQLEENEDALSEKALELGLGRLIGIAQAAGGDLGFSCIALAPSLR